MHQSPLRAPRRLRPPSAVLLAAAAALVVVAMLAVAAFAASRTLQLKTVQNAHVGARILVTPRGMTLYTNAAESRSRIVCTSDCLANWLPLRVRKGVTPKGIAHLGVRTRKEGWRQVTYKGRPVYAYAGDYQRGDAGGEGFRDVGTWHVIRAPQPAPEPRTDPTPPPPPGGYGSY